MMADRNRPEIDGLFLAENVRKRPAMYVGSVGFFGYIHYLVCPVALLLEQRPTQVAITARDDGFVIESDVAVPFEAAPSGRLSTFIRELPEEGPGYRFEGLILAALSERLTVEVQCGHQTETLTFQRGTRESHQVAACESDRLKTTLAFAPDLSIFTVTDLSPALFASYLRRLSFLYRGVRFSITFGAETQEFYAERGIGDLFTAITAPYQILHEPIHILGEEGSLQLEMIFAYHSWKKSRVHCFINNGRAVEGGTHELGLTDALKQLYRKLKLPKPLNSPRAHRNGIIGILSLRYPNTVWQGCLKARVGNPELREMVRKLIVERAVEWVNDHPDVAKQLQTLETFQFPDIWYV